MAAAASAREMSRRLASRRTPGASARRSRKEASTSTWLLPAPVCGVLQPTSPTESDKAPARMCLRFIRASPVFVQVDVLAESPTPRYGFEPGDTLFGRRVGREQG